MDVPGYSLRMSMAPHSNDSRDRKSYISLYMWPYFNFVGKSNVQWLWCTLPWSHAYERGRPVTSSCCTSNALLCSQLALGWCERYKIVATLVIKKPWAFFPLYLRCCLTLAISVLFFYEHFYRSLHFCVNMCSLCLQPWLFLGARLLVCQTGWSVTVLGYNICLCTVW